MRRIGIDATRRPGRVFVSIYSVLHGPRRCRSYSQAARVLGLRNIDVELGASVKVMIQIDSMMSSRSAIQEFNCLIEHWRNIETILLEYLHGIVDRHLWPDQNLRLLILLSNNCVVQTISHLAVLQVDSQHVLIDFIIAAVA